MPIQEIVQLKRSENEEIKAAFLLAIHCAPILRGSKAANIVTVTQEEFFRVYHLLEGTEICCRFFKTKGEMGISYLYREKEIGEYLHTEKIQSFLNGYGYQNSSTSDMLEQLAERMNMYNRGMIAFPHEIGVFLEYPLHDVKGFLVNHGRNYVYSGYWKVYQKLEGALQTFKRFDEDRDYVIRAVLSGRTIREIVMDTVLE